MNSVPRHLMTEDRIAYERALDEALHSAPHQSDAAAAGVRHLNTEQLRTMALSATALITAAAATEYERYVRAREELRHPERFSEPAKSAAESGSSRSREGSGRATGPGRAPDPGPTADHGPTTGSGPTDDSGRAPASDSDSSREAGSVAEAVREIDATGNLAAGAVEVVEGAGAGVLAVTAVLAPLLAGAAAVIFLLVGYLLKAVSPGTSFAATMVTTGWLFAALTAVAVLVAAAGLLLTALRNSAAAAPAARAEHARLAEVERARQDWLDALTERGIRPFLAEALAHPATTGTAAPHPAEPGPRMPRLGYHRPGFSSPRDADGAVAPPRYSSPDYSSPDFGGPRTSSGRD